MCEYSVQNYCSQGGVGKSTVTSTLARCFATKGRGQKKYWFFFTFGQSKKSLSEKTGIFLTISPKRGGGLGQVKKSLSEKTEVVKKGGGGSQFFN